ncbi:F0F1 ATP synthase subunit epsilon [Ectothiorhodospira sp. 9100]|uniref:F0F1 ATP synthase subunit epsilon n=1 Tax=unclassified Ectothiorhodospira TaxID=2684909 RepID=UPI001EE7D6F9|nr:F0F1 ATP synthase subunit epsilon [Ectothiorhodospira sp. 9100]MCG5518137.1 F0F1 ATP synthase subunit epsilon [Ectothiorhodospira sp. 9905]
MTVREHSLPLTATMDLEIVSAESSFFSGPVHKVCLTGTNGELGIFPGHSALLTHIVPGVVRYLPSGHAEEDLLYISGGMLEIQPHRVIVLADTALRSNEIDEQAALEAKRDAEEIMRESVLFTDRDAAQAEFLRAVAQLKVLDRLRQKNRKNGRSARGTE